MERPAPVRKRRARLTSRDFQELIEAREWCARNDFTAFRAFYDELLSFHNKRRALPPEAYHDVPQPDEEDRRDERQTRE